MTDLARVLRGHVTALQTVFTGCSAICPIQGALFAQAQQAMGDATEFSGVRLLSVSIDPQGDTSGALRHWLAQFGADTSRWSAVRPEPGDVGRLNQILTRTGEAVDGRADVHSGQVFVVNRRGELAFRTSAMPPAAEIVAAIRYVSERA